MQMVRPVFTTDHDQLASPPRHPCPGGNPVSNNPPKALTIPLNEPTGHSVNTIIPSIDYTRHPSNRPRTSPKVVRNMQAGFSQTSSRKAKWMVAIVLLLILTLVSIPFIGWLSRIRISVSTQQTLYRDPQTLNVAMGQTFLTDNDIIEMIKQNPKLVKLRAFDGNTPLHAAIFYKRYNVMKKLIEMGADVNRKTAGEFGGDTPLHVAIIDDRPKAVEILLEYGADPMIENQMGETSQEHAERLRRHKIVAILEQHDK